MAHAAVGSKEGGVASRIESFPLQQFKVRISREFLESCATEEFFRPFGVATPVWLSRKRRIHEWRLRVTSARKPSGSANGEGPALSETQYPISMKVGKRDQSDPILAGTRRE